MIQMESEIKMTGGANKFTLYAAGIFVFALVIRLVHLWQIYPTPFFTILMGDAQVYDAWAQQIATVDWVGKEVFFQSPLYPYFLGTIYMIAGHSLLVVRIVQVLLGAISCVLIADCGRKFFSKRTGVIAGVMLAIYAPAIFFDGLIQKSALDLFFLCLMLWLLSKIVLRPSKVLWFSIGLATGGLTLNRENALVLVVAIVLWLFLYYRPIRLRTFAFAALFMAGLAVVLLPVAMRNKIVGDQFHLTTSQFGYNFYLGNHAEADGYYRPLKYGRGITKYERHDTIAIAEEAMGKELTPSEVSDYWAGRAFDYIKTEPLSWLKLMLKKFTLVWKAIEMVDVEDQYSYGDVSVGLGIANHICHFGIIAPMGLLGLWITWPKRGNLAVLYLMFAAYVASIVIFYMVARYRYPLVPFVILFASAGLSGLGYFLRKKPVYTVLLCLALVVGLALFCNWPDKKISKDKMRMTTHYNLGVELKFQGRVDEAISEYRKALTLEPDHYDALNNLGNALASKGLLKEAEMHLRHSTEILPDPDGLYNLACVFARQGNYDEAITYFGRSVRISPHPLTLSKMASVFEMNGQIEEAIKHYQMSLKTQPHAKTYFGLANLFRRNHRLDEALENYRQAMQLDANDIEVFTNIGIVLAMQGKLDEGIGYIQKALLISPGDARLLKNLAIMRKMKQDSKTENPDTPHL